MAFKCDRRLYLTKDRKRVVEEGDVDSGFLLASRGGEISTADVERYGLKCGAEGKIILPATAESKAKKKTEDKAAKKTEDKAAKKTEDKASDTGTARPPDVKA